MSRARAILHSFSFRLALLYMLLLGASVVVLLWFIDWSTGGYMARQTDATIAAEIRGLAEQYRQSGLEGLSSTIAERISHDPDGAAVYLLADAKLQPLMGNLAAWPQVEPDRNGWVQFELHDPNAAGGAATQTARAQVFVLRGGLRLLVGRDIRELTATRALIRDALGWGLAITLGLALLGGWVMSAGVVRRLEAVNQVSREIIDGDLSRRVPTDGSGDDFDQLAENLNRMLARIETLMASVRQVSDNIAHDLRTPLSRLHTRLSELRDTGLPEPAATAVDAAIGDAEDLLGAFNGLLRIARVESGARRAAFADLDLATLLHDVAELYEPLASDKDQSLQVSAATGLSVNGDRDLLFQALANLIDNAIKYTPSGGRIALTAAREDGAVAIRVSDSGPGIPPELRGKVLQRFFRVDTSRSAPGHGLGLSLVQAVAQLHGAELRLEDEGPGLRVMLRLDAAAAGGNGSPPGKR
jgi:signal transduction histidine kinase